MSVFQQFDGFSEYEGVAQGPPANHNGITAGVFQHTPGILGRPYVTVADYRNIQVFFHHCNHIPVGLPGKKLSPAAGVQSYGTGPLHLRRSGQFDTSFIIVIPAFAHFNGYRNLDRFDDCPDYFPGPGYIKHQGCPFTVFNYLGGGTAHVDIYQISSQFFQNQSPFCHRLRLRAEYLQGQGRVFPAAFR